MNTDEKDPIQRIEAMVKEIHDSAGKITRPVLRRYPLLFAFLTIFSVAAILHGFELIVEQIELLNEHPSYLIIIGIVSLFLTGMLYKIIRKKRNFLSAFLTRV